MNRGWYDWPLSFVFLKLFLDIQEHITYFIYVFFTLYLFIYPAVYFALKNALYEARRENGQEGFFDLAMPSTSEVRVLAGGVTPSMYKLH